MPLRTKILDILEKDARHTVQEIAAMVGEEESTVADLIEKMENDGIILGYKTIVNPEKVMEEKVTCLIEVSVQPERGHGFDKSAELIYRFPEVQSVYLVSGGKDLVILIEGQNMREIADFVSEKLSLLPNVTATASHFVLKKYKEMGSILVKHSDRERLPVSS